MELKIHLMNGDVRSLSVQPDKTVMDLKKLVYQVCNVPVATQRLSSENGQKISLSDDLKPLFSYGLRSGSKVWVLITEPAPFQLTTEPAPFQVFLKNEKGQVHTYDVAPGETVSQFKGKVRNKEGVPTDQQRLVHDGKQLEDGKTLKDYGIKAQSTIYLMLRLRGG